MGYEYSSNANRGFFHDNRKKIAVAGLIVFLIAVFFYTGSTLTGYITYSNTLEQQLNTTKAELSNVQAQRQSCVSSLDNANNNLQNCNNNLVSSKTSLDSCISGRQEEREELNEEITILSSAVEVCEKNVASSGGALNELAKNSVRAICCSFADVQSAVIRNWNIINNSISCIGENTVNCATGEITY